MAIDSSRKINYGPISLEIASTSAEQSIDAIVKRLDDDTETTKSIAEMMGAFVRANLIGVSGPALLPATIARKQRGGWSAAPLQKTGTLLANINTRSRKHYAAAVRDKGSGSGNARSLPFAFMHDMGVGRYEERPFMNMTSAQMEQVFATYDRFVERVLNE